ncbi:MAG: hypothetical protein WD069_05350 [Planctomycetales bacterium]
MGKIIRYEYVGGSGDTLYIVATFLVAVLMPLSFIRLVQCIVRIEEEIEDPTEFIAAFRAGRLART